MASPKLPSACLCRTSDPLPAPPGFCNTCCFYLVLTYNNDVGFAILAAAAALAPTRILAERLITVTNRCPHAITLYINGQTQGLLATSSATNRTFYDFLNGLIYTDANGEGANGASTTKARFYVPTNYHYVVKDTTTCVPGSASCQRPTYLPDSSDCDITAAQR
ncbi:hypothetical protein GALMADRAFT_409624 [Galerina marginata CBS 339.88]|uniref:Uncharacterized protein n=1 Tax=Galerina marginata (strain CBS 339.88) TaxID=685588 RepID=A0A067TF77_GALM3|nr:hypothetical protein GALMADRAFT_409624 [Galerina marginata CBS 339.88]